MLLFILLFTVGRADVTIDVLITPVTIVCPLVNVVLSCVFC